VIKKFKYGYVFVITVIILIIIQTLACLIPKNLIIENIRETKECYNNVSYTENFWISKRYTCVQYYADAILLNIIANIDEKKPIKSFMEAKYYSPTEDKTITYDFEEMLDENKEGNVQYMRYWHGSMSIIRPLLVFFNINQIYILNAIVFSILFIILVWLLVKVKLKEIAISFVFAMVSVNFIMVPFCLEYYWTFLIMVISSILVIIFEKKSKDISTLFFLIGIMTCYLDFLSTETITCLVPMIILLTMRYKENKITKFSEGFKLFFKLGFLWFVGYAGMWLAKWILSSLILGINIFETLGGDLMLRITGETTMKSGIVLEKIENLEFKALKFNFETIMLVDFLKEFDLTKTVVIASIIIEVLLIRKKDMNKLWFSGLLLIIAIIPYIRYVLLAAHSYSHCYFTFRSQLISIMAIILAMFYSIDMKKLIGEKNKNEGC